MKKNYTILSLSVMLTASMLLNAQESTTGTIEIGGVEYATVVMKDGRTWMAENLRYVPEGRQITPLNNQDAEKATGIYYPATFEVVNGVATVTPTDDVNAITQMGLLYTTDIFMNGENMPTEDFTDAANIQGIAPKGWHIPTAQEWIDLVGACSNTTLNNTDAPYYDAPLSGASLEALNADGFNMLPYPYFMTNTSKYLGTWLNKDESRAYSSYCSMAYFASSTGRSEKQSYAAMITNNTVKSSVNCAYNNYTNAVFVRFIKDKNDTPSNIETISIPAQKGVYSIMGVYLGEDATNLPQGVYIINGEKVIR